MMRMIIIIIHIFAMGGSLMGIAYRKIDNYRVQVVFIKGGKAQDFGVLENSLARNLIMDNIRMMRPWLKAKGEAVQIIKL